MKPGTVVVGYLDGGHWSASFGLSYRDLCLHDALVSQRIVREGGVELRALTGSGGIPASRNKVVADFLVTDAEWLFFVDTDMGFEPNTVDRLVEAADPVERPILGALCFAQKKSGRHPALHVEEYVITPTVYEYAEADDSVGFRPIGLYDRDAVMLVAGTGAACLLIHRTVLERVRDKYGPAWFDPIVHPTGARGGPRTFSEDLSFCVRCQAVDIPIHVDTRVKTSHEKGGLFLTEDAYDRERTLAAYEKSCSEPMKESA